MKKYLIVISKILVCIFLLFCIIGITWVVFHKEPEITVSGYFIIPFAIITIFTALVFFIMFIWEMIEVIREKNKERIKKFIAEISLSIILGFAVEVFVIKNEVNIVIIWCFMIAICMISFALQFWKRKSA